MIEGEGMEDLVLDTEIFGNEKEILEDATKRANSLPMIYKKTHTPLSLVKEEIEKCLPNLPDHLIEPFTQAYGLCLINKWEGLTEEQYALLWSVRSLAIDILWGE